MNIYINSAGILRINSALGAVAFSNMLYINRRLISTDGFQVFTGAYSHSSFPN